MDSQSIFNQPKDPRFISNPDVANLPVLESPGANIRNAAVCWPDASLMIQNAGDEDVSNLPILESPSDQNTRKKDDNRR